ncbi:MAG: hypothetical protein PVH61_39560 [Candidatus Aminicenantes bacterium]|jgi:hypothetical protein
MEGENTSIEPGALIKDNQGKKRDIGNENKYKLYFNGNRVHLEEFIEQEGRADENCRAND